VHVTVTSPSIPDREIDAIVRVTSGLVMQNLYQQPLNAELSGAVLSPHFHSRVSAAMLQSQWSAISPPHLGGALNARPESVGARVYNAVARDIRLPHRSARGCRAFCC
jgi:hypothetical protein